MRITGRDINSDRILNIYSIEQIRQKHFRTYQIEDVKDVLRDYIQENRENEPPELLDNERTVDELTQDVPVVKNMHIEYF